jgi:hypothetical protein
MKRPLELAAFQRAFVATSYLLDQRGDALLAPLGKPLPETLELVRGLGHAEKQARAVVLAREVVPIVSALEQRRIT